MSGKDELKKIEFPKEIAINAMENSVEFDKNLMENKVEYRKAVAEAYNPVWNLLEKNLELADTEEERKEIRADAKEIVDKERNEEKDYDEFAKSAQKNRNELISNIILIVTCVTAGGIAGLITCKRPLMNKGKRFFIEG